MSQRRILLIDGSSLAFRSFYAIMNLESFRNQEGLHTNALFSFHRMLETILNRFNPTHVLVAFDQSGPTVRTAQYAEYKAGRSKAPSEFTEQMPYFSVLLDAFGIPYYSMADYEADDIVGTLAHHADPEDEVSIVTGDLDYIQLASANTTVYITRKGVSELQDYTPEAIEAEYGIGPDQVVDMMGLMGDPSDNIPGVTRIGEKTALKLLHEYQTIDELYARIDELKPSKMKENLVNEKETAYLSRDLARIIVDAPVELDIDAIQRRPKDRDQLMDFYQKMNFNTFRQKLLEESDEDTPAVKAQEDLLEGITVTYLTEIEPTHLPKEAVFYTEILGSNYHRDLIEAVCWYDRIDQVYMTSFDTALKSEPFLAWLADPKASKWLYDSKKEQVIAHRLNSQLKGIQEDLAIANYLVDTHNHRDLSDILASTGLPYALESDETFYGKGVKRGIPEDTTSFHDHLARKLRAIHLLIPERLEKLNEAEMMDLYQTIERPLAQVLAQMEITGIHVKRTILEEKNQDLLARLGRMEEEIYQLAGETFNINSPKQLGEILFDKLELPVIKKTKTGYSTAADVLEKLQHSHPIIPLLMEYRTLAKLQSTYLSSLPDYILEDGKIHTIYDQTLTQTGRLSSNEPNLQNIPVRLEEGRQIRQAFVPSHSHWQLFSADYSQIELRILAHISGDQAMIDAFLHGADIHASTAQKVFHLPEGEPVSSDYRRQAKAVNFGIVYGISDYGLSQNLNISRKEAQAFIDRYFQTYPNIHRYMEDIVQDAKEKGYVETLFHRRRYLPDLKSRNFNIRSFAERTAINTPIQGTAADIIKIAMIQLNQALEERELQSRLLLQVHDELILEGPSEEMEVLSDLVPEIMEQAVQLSVPLTVEYNQGNNWYEL